MEEQTIKRKRWNPWPYAIVLAMLLFISSIAYAVALMMDTDVSLVAEDYYGEELRYQEQIDIERRTIQTDRIPKLVAEKNGTAVTIEFTENSSIEMGAGEISFERPADPNLDFKVPVNPGPDGKQFIDLGKAEKGLYLVRISWQEAEQDYYHEIKYSF